MERLIEAAAALDIWP